MTYDLWLLLLALATIVWLLLYTIAMIIICYCYYLLIAMLIATTKLVGLALPESMATESSAQMFGGHLLKHPNIVSGWWLFIESR